VKVAEGTSIQISRFKIYKNTFMHNALQKDAPLTCAFSDERLSLAHLPTIHPPLCTQENTLIHPLTHSFIPITPHDFSPIRGAGT
jgi:hypothetical protein